jgi:hypothetical protein
MRMQNQRARRGLRSQSGHLRVQGQGELSLYRPGRGAPLRASRRPGARNLTALANFRQSSDAL